MADAPTSDMPPPAPVAHMTESQDAASLAEATIGVLNGTHTLSGRRRRPVKRQGFVYTPEFVDEFGSVSESPEPTGRSNTSPRGSPDLGTPSRAQSHLGDLQNASTILESVAAEVPPTKHTAPPKEESDARRAMPPPPIPLPQSVVKATPKLPRISIKYRIQKSPGVFRVWDPRGTFKSLSMDELQTIHGFQDVDSVQFILQRRGMSWDDLVPKDDDVAFQDMKIRFEEKISDDYDEIGERRGVVYYDILVIPVRNTEDSRESVREQSISL
ncbi:hypothetical protein FAVG1_09534 [Fusarium avenaceum]|nr:hypothetical protein FAVG1_09534 [Fusarium avenaceum]